MGLVLPAASGASVLPPWGSSLSATPNLDTANGASTQYTNQEPASSYYGPGHDEAIRTSYKDGCARTLGQGSSGVTLGCTPWMKSGADVAVWNTQVAGGTARAPAGGQVRAVNLKGCSVKDDTSPVQYSKVPGEAGVPVGSIEFQDLTPNADGSFTSNVTAGVFQVPFCSNSADPTSGSTNTSTLTSYRPIHFCVKQGDVIGIFQSGGFVPSPTDSDGDGNGGSGVGDNDADDAGPWYPQGAPVMIMASVNGSGMDSFADSDLANKTDPAMYTPGAQPRGDNSGWGQESNQEVQLQVIEGVGDDAYGLCPGGDAVEPTSSNSVVCVTRSTTPNDPYGSCNAQNQPVRPPRNQSRPTIYVSSNGTPVSGAPVPGNRMDATPGTWTQDPNQNFIRYAYQWEDCDSSGANCTPIGGQAGKNPYYYATNSDVSHTIEVAVSATNTANTEGPASSAHTQVVAGPNVPVITTVKLNPSTWNESQASVLTYYDSEAATATIQVLQNGAVVRTITNSDRAKQYGGNGVKLAGLKAGNYQLQITPSNRGTTGQTLTLSFTVSSATPVISSPRINPSSFNSARGATVTYTDSLTGNAVLSVVKCQRKKKGVCTKFKTFKTFRHQDRAGPNGVKMNGIAAGHYRLQIVSTYAGRKSTAVLTPFTAKVVHKRHHKRHGVRHRAPDVGAAVASVFG